MVSRGTNARRSKEVQEPISMVDQGVLDWLVKYSDVDVDEKRKRRYANDVIYKISSRADYLRATLDFISGMTDNFAIKMFEELIRFQ